MPIESALIKPVVDALLGLLRRGESVQLQRHAEKALREAIRELLLANPDENKAAARIAIAKAAGILSADVVLAEDMLHKHRASKARTRGKVSASRKPSRKAGAGATQAPAAPVSASASASAKPATRTPASRTPASRKPASRKPATRATSRAGTAPRTPARAGDDVQ